MGPGVFGAHHCVCGFRGRYSSLQTSQELGTREDLGREDPSPQRLMHCLLQLSMDPVLHPLSTLLNKTELENPLDFL